MTFLQSRRRRQATEKVNLNRYTNVHFIPGNVSTLVQLDLFEKKGSSTKVILGFNFWEHENHPILLDTESKFQQRFTYLNENPVRAGFVREPQDWHYSSAIDCYTNGKRLVDLVRVD